MIPPKYKFYIGKGTHLNWVANRQLSPLNGTYTIDIPSDGITNYWATDKIEIAEDEELYITVAPISNARGGNICFYDASQNFIKYIDITKAGLIPKPSNALYFAIDINRYDGAIYDKKKSNEDFLFKLETVKPHYKTLNKKYAKETGQEFFRITIDGKITLVGEDYEKVSNANIEDTLLFIITKYDRSTGSWNGYYDSIFSKTDCKLDRSKKICELKANPLDAYTEIMNRYDNTYDLIKLAPALRKINLWKRSMIQVYVSGYNTITNIFSGTYWESDVNEAINDKNELINKYYFSYVGSSNEIEVSGAGISAVNGLYAGTTAGYNTTWSNQDLSYTIYTETHPGMTNYNRDIILKRNSDDTILYRSSMYYIFGAQVTGTSEVVLPAGASIEMVNVNNANDKFNLSNVFLFMLYQRLLCDVDSVEDSEGIKATYDLPIDDFATTDRNYKKCIGLKGGMFVATAKTVNEPTKYGQNDYGKYFTDNFVSPSSGLGRPIPISRSTWINTSLWYIYSSLYEIWESSFRKQFVLKNAYSISDAIKALLKKIDPSISHEATSEYSQFLYANNCPIIVPQRFYVYITPKSNVLKGEYDQAAQKAEITLEEIMKMLRDCFRCYWYIEDNKLKIEHIKFFMNGGSYTANTATQLDLTKLKDQFNKMQANYFQSEIEYDKDDLAARYEFSWMDDATELFGGLTLDVKSNYVQQDNTEEISISQFSSDIDYMMFNPSSFSEDGFALLCPIKKSDGSFEVPIVSAGLKDEEGDNYSAIAQNWYASWAFLTSTFYNYDMPAEKVECNMLPEFYIDDVKKCMNHTIEVSIEDDLDERQLIKTSIGLGKIDEYSVNIDTRLAKIKLVYKPQ